MDRPGAPDYIPRMNRAAFALASLVACAAILPASAEERKYAIEIPDNQLSGFEVPLEVMHPGAVVVEAEWTGSRIVSFRLEGPGDLGVVTRRSGPSPQKLDTWVTEGLLERGSSWKLVIRSLPSRGASSGTVRVVLPDAPEVVRAREAELTPPPPPPPPPDPITLPVKAPAEASAGIARLYTSAEPFRALVFPAQGDVVYDACGWQRDLLRWLLDLRSRAVAGKPAIDENTNRYLQRVAAAVHEIDKIRTSKNYLIAGPPPEDSLRRRAWEAARGDELRPLERELDVLVEMLKKGYVTGTSAETWPSRWLACVVACERNFEQRPRVAPDPAANEELAEAQWSRILAAADAIEALRTFLPESYNARGDRP